MTLKHYTPDEVDNMKRKELQRLAKQLGIRANLKNLTLKQEINAKFAQQGATAMDTDTEGQAQEQPHEQGQADAASSLPHESTAESEDEPAPAQDMDLVPDQVEETKARRRSTRLRKTSPEDPLAGISVAASTAEDQAEPKPMFTDIEAKPEALQVEVRKAAQLCLYSAACTVF